MQSGQGERPAEPVALLGGPKPQHVDLADPLRSGALWHAGVLRSVLLARRLHLGPVQTCHLAVSFRDEEPRRVKPRLPLAQVKVVPGPSPLLWMLGERPAVEAQPLILIPAGDEGAQRATGREDRL